MKTSANHTNKKEKSLNAASFTKDTVSNGERMSYLPPATSQLKASSEQEGNEESGPLGKSMSGQREFSPPVSPLRSNNSTSPLQLQINNRYTTGTGKQSELINDLIVEYNRVDSTAPDARNGNGEDLKVSKVHLLEKIRKHVKQDLSDKTVDADPGKMRSIKNTITGSSGLAEQKRDELKVLLDEVKEELRSVGGNAFNLNTMERAAAMGDDHKASMGKSMKRLFKEMYLKKIHSNRLLSQTEIEQLKLIERGQGLDASFLEDEVKTGTYRQAIHYIDSKNYKDWVQIHPNKRLLITSIISLSVGGTTNGDISLGPDELKKTPAYAMGLSLSGNKDAIREHTASNWEKTLDGGQIDYQNLTDEQKAVIRQQIEDYSARDDGYFKKKARKKAKKKGLNTDRLSEIQIQQKIQEFQTRNDNALKILKKVFILLQAGLKERTKEGDYKSWQENVSTALSHGGRVNVKIPRLANKNQDPKELLNWLEITQGGHKNKEAGIVKRSFGTHHMEIDDSKDIFKETGGKKAALKNKLGSTEIFGLDLAVGGFGNMDFNGEFILPDGANGHMFIGFKPPTLKDSGALEIGVETTGPGAHSNVGYIHNWNSTEATANPLSSSGGAKADKHGQGKMDWSRIELTDLEVPFTNDVTTWVQQLNQMEGLINQYEQSGNMTNKDIVGKKFTN